MMQSVAVFRAVCPPQILSALRYGLFLLLLTAGCFLGGCASTGDYDETAGWSAQKIYNEAKENAADGGWDRAAKLYEKLEARYPYGRYAQQAQLEIAYAWWKADEIPTALAACDRFIKLHPNHSAVDYIYYLKGLITFNEDLGYVAYLSTQDTSERDPKSARESFNAFSELVKRFPESKYAPDATKRMRYLVNSLAMHEVHVARYYIKRKAYVAAAARAQYAVETYQGTPAVEEALYIMALAYESLGLTALQQDALRVMKQSFPESPFYTKGLVRETSWWQLW